MADDDQNKEDEYQFADFDVLGAEQDAVSLPEDELLEGAREGVSSPPGRGRFSQLDPQVVKMIRNGAIAVGALFAVLAMYKIVGALFSSKPETKKIAPTPMVASAPKAVSKPIQVSPPLPMTSTTSTDRTKEVSSLQEKQERLEREVLAIRSEVNTVTQNVSDMSAKMADLKQTMLVLSERLTQQSEQMSRLQTTHYKKQMSISKERRPAVIAPKPVYTIQAIIPGRAWLMSNQGNTLTVSRGSMVPGYGTVRLINAQIGRVFTSSGRVIQFSQADS